MPNVVDVNQAGSTVRREVVRRRVGWAVLLRHTLPCQAGLVRRVVESCLTASLASQMPRRWHGVMVWRAE
jgi:hypothetical protein